MTPPTSAAECEACREMKKDYPTGLGPMYGDPENNYGKFDIVLTAQAHHHHEAVQDARIRELVATVQSAIRIYRQVESERRPNGKGLSPFFFGQRLRRLIREWVELSEAALARSSEVPK